jgi:hypothetical protein
MNDRKISVILTGATGMAGEGVLHECLNDPSVESILIVGRRPSGTIHSKVSELILPDLSSPGPIREKLKGYHACFFCMGVSSIGMKEPEYSKLTYDLTLSFASLLKELNPAITFCYISGAGTDSTEKGRSMWARVKGRTENALLKMFPNAYMFRPGYMQPTAGLKNTLKMYRYVAWLYPLLKLLAPRFTGRLSHLGQAMIHVALHGYEKHHLEVPDIRDAATKAHKGISNNLAITSLGAP